MMNTKKNIMYTMVYQILAIIVPLITTPYISRVLGPEYLGIHSYTYSVVQYFMMFSLFGFEDYGNRSIAQTIDDKKELGKKFFSIYSLQFAISSVIVCFYIIYLVLFVRQNNTIAFLQIFYLLSSLVNINWFFWGIQEFRITITRNIIIKIINTFLIFIFVKNVDDLWKYTAILSIGMLLNNSILWAFIFKYVSWVRPSLKNIIKHFGPCLILFLPLVSRSIFVYMDKIMLGKISTMTQVGFYENSEKLILAPTAIATSLGTVMLPKVTNLISRGQADVAKQYIKQSIQMVMLMAMAFSFGLAAVAPTFAPLYFGSGFNECGKIIPIMAITIVFVSWSNIFKTQYLIPCKKDRAFVVSVTLGAVVNFIVNFMTIKSFGARGAAWGWVLAELAITFYQAFISKKDLEIFTYLKETVPFLIIGFVMFIAVRCAGMLQKPLGELLIIQIGVGVLVYMALSYLYIKKMRREIIDLIKRK